MDIVPCVAAAAGMHIFIDLALASAVAFGPGWAITQWIRHCDTHHHDKEAEHGEL